jgi:lysine 6-dehydrogenase
MKRYAVIGASMIGRVIAKDLLETEPDAHVTLLDLDTGLLDEVTELLASVEDVDNRLATQEMDVRDTARVAQALQGHDAAIGALPHACALDALKAAVQAGVSMVDLVGSKPELRRELDGSAREANVLIVPGMGVAPGLSNVLIGRGVEILDEVHEGVIYAGGIPVQRTPPLEYQTVYSLVSMFGAVQRPARIWREGAWGEVEAFTGLELLAFPPPVGSLEAYYTDGLASLVLTMDNKFRDTLEGKTLRYPGFAERVGFLKRCGLLEMEPVEVGDVEMAPRDMLIRQLTPLLRLGPEGDILAMRVIVKGQSLGRDYTHTFELVDFMDPDTGDTAMARTTGFPATITARMMAAGTIAEEGVRFPEEIFSGPLWDVLLSELEVRGVKVTHVVE